MPRVKRCGKCKQWKPLSEFGRDKGKRNGLNSYCRKCQTVYLREYYQKNRERILKQVHEYRESHKDEEAERKRQYHLKHREEELMRSRIYYWTHRDKAIKYNHQYHLEHRAEIKRRISKKGGLGYNPLNEWFEGADMHHINDVDVIFIPKDIHLRFNGNGFTVEKHRKAILNYYGSFGRMMNDNPIGRTYG